MKMKSILSAAVAVAAGITPCTAGFARTTSREHPVEITDPEYSYAAFNNGNVLENKKQGRLPAMGWNSWNAFGSGNTEELTKQMADRIVELGLDELGYEYVVLDDGCYKSERDENGRITNNPDKFPSGFRSLADYIHEKGLKFGMYNDIGTNLCAGAAVGTCGYEDIDAKTYIDWGVDFLKVDNCYYLWDNATGSDAANAKYTYAPNIRGIKVSGNGTDITLSAVNDGELTGSGARKNTAGDYVTNIGTADGTGTGVTPVGEQSGELVFRVNAPTAGEYTVTVNYASGEQVGTGSWLQLAVGPVENETRYFDNMLPATGGTEAFADSDPITVELAEGENIIRIMNHRRQENTLNSYAALLDGLNKADPDHDVLLSICEWGKSQPQNWGYKVGSSWRILNDISFAVGGDGNPGSANWSSGYTDSITSQYSKAVIMDEYAGLDRGWNDPDMMVIGMNGITTTMSKTHMAMWCMMNSPLMLGIDLRRVEKGDELYNIIANEELIALDQDSLGIQAKRIYSSLAQSQPDKEYITNNERVDILAKPLANGDVALSFINLSESANDGTYSVNVDTIMSYIGGKMADDAVREAFENAEYYKVTDLWTDRVTLNRSGEFEVSGLEGCGNVTVRISPAKGGDTETFRAALEGRIDQAEEEIASTDCGGKTLLESAVSAYESAVEAAGAVLEDDTADAETLFNAYNSIDDAAADMEAVFAAYEDFGNAVDAAKAKAESGRYIENEALETFKNTVSAAERVLEDPKTVEEMTAAQQAMEDAGNKLSRDLDDGFEPIAWYTFENQAGNKTVTDASGNGNDAKLMGNDIEITADSKLSLNMNNGNDGYMELPDGMLSDAEDFTFASWVYIAEKRDYSRIFDFGISTDSYMFLSPYGGSDTVLDYAITAGGLGGEQTLMAERPETGKWMHTAVTRSGNTVTLYVDGEPVVQSTEITNKPSDALEAASKSYIGKSQFASDPYFKGQLMDIRIYDKALTDEQILVMMNDFGEGITPHNYTDTPSEPVFAFDFDDGKTPENAVMQGGASFVNDAEKNSGVLYLDGTAGTYMQFDAPRDENGKVLEEYTVSFDVKNLTEGTYFNFYIGDGSSNGMGSNYLGLKAADSVLLSTRDTSNEILEYYYIGGVHGAWRHFDITVSNGIVKAYADGSFIGALYDTYTMDELGAEVIRFGFSAWSADNYSNAYYDNIYVYPEALTLEGLKAAAEQQQKPEPTPEQKGPAVTGLAYSDGTVSFALENAQDSCDAVNVYIAEYDEEGRLAGLSAEYVPIESDRQEIGVEHAKADGQNTMTLMLWTGEMTPLVNAAEIK